MTNLTITPKYGEKTAKFRGLVAAGEHVAVVVKGCAAWIGDAEASTLRLRAVGVCGETLAQFPVPGGEDAWGVNGEDAVCVMNLNTVQMLMAVPKMATVPVLFVLDDPANHIVYFKDFCQMTHWPRCAGAEEPVDLNGYPDILAQTQAALAAYEARVAEVEGRMGGVEAHMAAVEDGVSGLGERVAHAEGTMAQLIGRIEDINDPTQILRGESATTNTTAGIRAAIKKIFEAFGGTFVKAAAFALLPCAAFSAGVTVEKADLNELDLDAAQVVTNVTADFEGLATADDLDAATNALAAVAHTGDYADLDNTSDIPPAPDYSNTNAALVATIRDTAPAPGNYAAVSNAAMSAVQSETDPTVPAWAKAATKPTYTAAEVGALASESDPHALLRDAYSITTAGLITDWLIDNNLYGGVRIRYSSRNLDNYTAYAYNGIAVRRDNATQDYLFDAAHSNGIVRRAELDAYQPKGDYATNGNYAAKSDLDGYLPLSGGTITGSLHVGPQNDDSRRYRLYIHGLGSDAVWRVIDIESWGFGIKEGDETRYQIVFPSQAGTLALISDISSATNATHQSLASDIATATNALSQSAAAAHQSLASGFASDLAAATNSLAAAGTAAHQSLASDLADSLASATNATLAAANAALDAEIDLWFRSTNAWISVSNGVARVYEIVGANSVLKYEWDSAHSNDAARVAALESAMPRKIEDPRRWADWTASGVSNSTGAVMLDRGAVYFGSTNVTWATDGGFAVMTSHSLPASASGGSSQFRIGIDTEDWFGFEVTASYLVNALPTGFSVDAQTAHTATIQTAYTAGYETTPPLVYYAQTLAQPFAPWDGGIVEWTHDGTVSTATVNGVSGTSGFFVLKAEVAGGAVFRSTMPALMEGYRVERAGEYVGTLQPDAIISITSGGKTYRVMAQEVQ